MRQQNKSNRTKTEGKLPTILVLDDTYAWDTQMRCQWCETFQVRDVTGSERFRGEPWLTKSTWLESTRTERSRDHIAEAVFHSGQRRNGDQTENNLECALDAVRFGHEGMSYWSMVLLDLRFQPVKLRGKGRLPSRHGKHDPSFGQKILESMAHDPELSGGYPGLTVVPVLTTSKRKARNNEAALNALGNLGYLELAQDDIVGNDPSHARNLSEALFAHGLFGDLEFGLIDDRGKVHRFDREGHTIIGFSLEFRRTLREARRASLSRRPCLIQGSAGTGKELLARYVHRVALFGNLVRDRCKPARTEQPDFITKLPRRNQEIWKSPEPEVYRAINSAAIPETLLESELFGYMPGSQGVVDKVRRGAIMDCNGGTFFLDEIGDIPAEVQTKLLRTIEYGKIQPLGLSEEIPVDVRFVAATNKDLDEIAAGGEYRRDLLSRMTVRFQLPDLVERKEDLNALFDFHLKRAWSKLPKRSGAVEEPEIDEGVWERLAELDWTSGNVRELKTVAERISVIRQFSRFVVPADVIPPPAQTRRRRKSEPRGSSRIGFEDVLSYLYQETPEGMENFQRQHKELMEGVARYTAKMFVSVYKAVERSHGEAKAKAVLGYLVDTTDLTTHQVRDCFQRLYKRLWVDYEVSLDEGERELLKKLMLSEKWTRRSKSTNGRNKKTSS